MGYYKESKNVYEEDYYVVREDDDIISYVNNSRQILKTPIIIFNNESINFNFKNYRLFDYKWIIKEEENANEQGNLFISENNIELIETEGALKMSPFQQIKIKIDYGDNKSEILNKPLVYRGENQWDAISHHYEISDTHFFDEKEPDDIDNIIEKTFGKKYISKILITLSNILNLKDTIIIPFDIENLSSAANGIKMELLSANLTNDNNISFAFNIINDKQVVFASNKEKS